MPSGGLRSPRGGRPKGSKDKPNTLRGAKARAYKELYEEEAVKVLAGVARVDESARRRAVRRLVAMQIDFALRYHDPRALHDMIERVVGKVPQPLEHTGPGGADLPAAPGLYVCQFSDGVPVSAAKPSMAPASPPDEGE